MKKIINIFLYILILTSISCEDKLDLKPLNDPTDVTFFSNAEQLQMAMYQIYARTFRPDLDGAPIGFYMECTLTDNGMYRTNGEMGLLSLSKSEQTPEGDLSQVYNSFYWSLSRVNNMLDNMPRAKENISEKKYNDFYAQALTMRCYFYQQLIQYYGPVPFLDFAPKSPTSGYISRMSLDDIVDRLLSDLDKAAENLDASLVGNHDRVTLSFIYGLKARIALYNSRFDIAASAADKCLVEAAKEGVELYPDYAELFTPKGEQSNEYIFRLVQDISLATSEAGYLRNIFPRNRGMRYINGQHWSTQVPSQNLVDAYPTINGLSIDEDLSYDPKNPWENRDPRMRASIIFPQDHWAEIVYESHRDSLKTYKISSDGSRSRINNPNCRSYLWAAGLSGYVWRKFVDEQAFYDIGISGYQDLFVMRLAEIYLIKAEAEIERSGGDFNAAAAALNKLRERAWNGSGTEYPKIVASSQEQMRKILRIERRVELAGEGEYRYVDMLRWGIAEKVRNQPLMGRILDIKNADNTSIPQIDMDGITIYDNVEKSYYDDWLSTKNSPTGFKSRLEGYWSNATDRNFTSPRDYLFPIPQSEIDLYKANGFTLTQNPGY